ncbi:MAG TPA: ABC transporter ATP-binding protein [Firmicutes bacterium]|nr:ABC transporter ATP-binding protein [Bacillota bacterium]
MLDIKELYVSYGRITALQGVSMHVPRSSIVCIIGNNGAGKSTLLNAISGMVKPKSGEITFEGRPLPAHPHQIVKAGIVQVPEGRQVFPILSVDENLTMGGYVLSYREIRERKARVYELFPRLKERAGQAAGTLSGGEQQMLAIGRALMSSPKVILFDEPSLGLAPMVVSQVFELIAKIKESGVTVVLVEQNARKALSVADTAYVLENGKVVLEGRASELLENPMVEAAYLGGRKSA